MKKSISIIAMVLIAAGLFAQEAVELKKNQGKSSNVPLNKTLKVEANQIDLGDEVELKERSVEIKVKNVGSEPIQLRKISTTAFLVVQSQPTEAIQPGSEALVVVKHIPNKDGQFLETLVLESDASNKMEVLKIFGTIATKQASIK